MNDEIYRELILEEYKRPKNKGRLAKATHESACKNPLCGDELAVTLLVRNGIMHDIKFEGVGCAISQASASLFTEHIKGKTVEAIGKMDEKVILELLGIDLNPMRMKCAVLIMRCVAAALEEKR